MSKSRNKSSMFTSAWHLSSLVFCPAILMSFRCHPVTKAFSPAAFSGLHFHHRPVCRYSSITSSTDTSLAPNSDRSIEDITSKLVVPVSLDDMILMASRAISDASNAGMTRQIVRMLLPRNPSSQLLGQFYEDDASTTNAWRSQLLVPPDETWQGGIMQLYRAALPTCTQLLRRLSSNIGGLPPRITEDRSIDESGVDGVGLLVAKNTAQQRIEEKDVYCFIQPLQETVDIIEELSKTNKGLIILMNPQWKTINDALDQASMQGGFFGNLASFLGGKANTIQRLQRIQYQPVFTVEGYICKGGNVRLLKRFDSDWVVFAEDEKEDGNSNFIRVGTSKNRPTYQEVDKMLDEKGIVSKYARAFTGFTTRPK